MRSRTLLGGILCGILLLSGCSSSLQQEGIDALMPEGEYGIARQTGPKNYQFTTYSELPTYDSASGAAFQVDLRNMNASGLLLEDRLDDLLHADFTTETIWPDSLPQGFDPIAIMESGYNPGLGIRNLHKSGISGKGVSVAVIDQTLFTEHDEYKARLKHYEEFNIYYSYPQMHGAAVASLTVGERAGVAPGANLYFWAYTCQETLNATKENYAFVAKAIERALDVNAALPKEEKIRVISISKGFTKNEKGKKEYLKAVERAKAEGVFLVTASIDSEYGVQIKELTRKPDSNPDDIASYTLPDAYHNLLTRNPERFENTLFVPAGARAYADIIAPDAYAYCAEAATSWAVPYIAGLYALGCQVDPDITPEKFLDIAQSTAGDINVFAGGKYHTLHGVIQPESFIQEIARRASSV